MLPIIFLSKKGDDNASNQDNFKLSRFKAAHTNTYQCALSEIQQGQKTSHWMWFIFPQIKGLAHSLTAKYYEIDSLEEAKAFLDDPILGVHLMEISSSLLSLNSNDATEIFGYPDGLKLKSSMTLFSLVNEGHTIFDDVLNKFFGGEKDEKTLGKVREKI